MNNQQNTFIKNFDKALDKWYTEGLTQQEATHNIMIQAISYCFQYSNDTSLIRKVLNKSLEVPFLRTESLAYWLKHVGGFSFTYDKNAKEYTPITLNKVKSFKSDLGIVFTFDSKHFDTMKMEKYRFWKIAPVVIKELKLAETFDDMAQGFINNVSRALLLEATTSEDIEVYVKTLTDKIKQATLAKNNQTWVEKFKEQNRISEIAELISAE